MERLILLLLSPAIFAERHKINEPKDEPFLPIYPVYPYSPKLIKRGTERELISRLTPELYAPKADAKDSYSASYSGSNNYQRETYYNPNYNPYPKNTSPSSTYPSYYSSDAYAYTSSPYAAYNPFPSPYAAVSPAPYSTSYPDYYFQPPYYYPHYYNHGLLPPPPPSSVATLSNVDYHETSQESETTAEDDKQNNENNESKKPNEDETNPADAPTSQFVDGGNYISGNSRDLDVQSSTYKVASPYNQLQQDVGAKNVPSISLPKTTYRVISVAGQPVGPNYPLPPSYVKVQQMEQLSHTLAALLAQNARQQQAGRYYESSNRGILNTANDGSYANQDTGYNSNAPSYLTAPDARAKTGAVSYTIDSNARVNAERTNLQRPSSRASPNKNAKHSNVVFVRKPTSQVTLNHSPQSTYILSDNRDKNRDRVIGDRPADQTEYDGYDASQNYDGTLNQFENKREQNYESQASLYQNKDFINAPQVAPQSVSYQYSAYEADQKTAQQPQQDNSSSSDGNFGAKQYNKG